MKWPCAVVRTNAVLRRRVEMANAAGRCEKYGYDRRGLESRVCPECGHLPAEAARYSRTLCEMVVKANEHALAMLAQRLAGQPWARWWQREVSVTPEIGLEHLSLGVLRGPEGSASRAIAACGAEREAVAAWVVSRLPKARRVVFAASTRLPMSSDASAMLGWARESSAKRGGTRVESADLLIALCGHGERGLKRELARRGIELARVIDAVKRDEFEEE